MFLIERHTFEKIFDMIHKYRKLQFQKKTSYI